MAEPATRGTAPSNMDNELRKMAEFFAQRVEATHHIALGLEQDFARSPEGKEAEYLKRTVLERSIDNVEHFIEYMVAGTPEKRGVHHLISFLENPPKDMARDEELVKRMKRLAEEMEKAKLPETDELRHYTELKRLISQLRDTADIHEFMGKFNNLLRSAAAYPGTFVARKVKSRSGEDIPAIIRMENFGFTTVLLKFMLSRLFRPDQRDMALRVIGRQDFKELVGNMAAKLKEGEDKVRSEIKRCFPDDIETDQINNLRAFTTAVAIEQKKSIFMKLIAELGNEQFAGTIRKMCGKKGKEKADPEIVKKIANQIIGMGRDDVKKKVEDAAKAELSEAVDKTLKGMEESVEKERKKFFDLISKRVDELQEAHAKSLKKVEEMDIRLQSAAKETALPGEIAASNVFEIKKVEESLDGFMQRAFDIMSVVRARIVLQDFAENRLDQGAAAAKMNIILSAGIGEGFFRDEVATMLNALSSPPEEFAKVVSHTDRINATLKAQLPEIIRRMRGLSEKTVKFADEFDGMGDEWEYQLKRSYAASMEEMRRLRKMGIDEERYSYEGHDFGEGHEFDYDEPREAA
ncbi:hypothetical protein JW898_00525 [Candidatus Woesearchaeota archaeon]|nr:hypothetical protein [Candidatus Woesearchaeota archaeon]